MSKLLKPGTEGKVFVQYILKKLPVYLAKAADEYGSEFECQSRGEAIIHALKSHPDIKSIVERRRREADFIHRSAVQKRRFE